MKRARFMDELMAEVIRYGGLPVRRCDAYSHALAALLTRTNDRRAAARAAEWFAFGARTLPIDAVPLTPEELEALDL
jgi:hypothetical protein